MDKCDLIFCDKIFFFRNSCLWNCPPTSCFQVNFDIWKILIQYQSLSAHVILLPSLLNGVFFFSSFLTFSNLFRVSAFLALLGKKWLKKKFLQQNCFWSFKIHSTCLLSWFVLLKCLGKKSFKSFVFFCIYDLAKIISHNHFKLICNYSSKKTFSVVSESFSDYENIGKCKHFNQKMFVVNSFVDWS